MMAGLTRGRGRAADALGARRRAAAWVHRSDDGGRTWAHSVELDTAPFVGGYGMRGGVVLPDGTIVLPLCDVPAYRRCSWCDPTTAASAGRAAVPVAAEPDRWFEEPAPLLLRSGRLLMLLRENRSKSLWQTWSDDGGRPGPSRRRPASTAIRRHLCQPARRPDPVHLRLSPPALRHPRRDLDRRGASWPEQDLVEIRSGLPTRDLGYPCTVPCEAGLLSVYYARDEAGCTCIFATRWRLPG